ncbi:MAG: hypothetical protein ABIW76_24550 [Fibrobacteria bacterium]
MPKPEATMPKVLMERTCVRCETVKPSSLFRINAAGKHTAWCESCRLDTAERYKIEADLVEMAHALYVLELANIKEARTVSGNNVAAGKESRAALALLETEIRRFETQRIHRLQYHAGKIALDCRNQFYGLVKMAPPEITVPGEELVAGF